MTKKSDFANLVDTACRSDALRKLVFSRPESSEIQKITGRLCSHRGRRILQLEYSLPGNTVSQKNVAEADVEAEIALLLDGYKQANLLTPLGDVEWKISKSGKEALLGADALRRKLTADTPYFERAIEALDKKKNYILTGGESFLIKLGISDSSGRVHDKKQGKFRQINRFLENIEDIYTELPQDKRIEIFDLCCGKSYLSFAVYYYLVYIKKRSVRLLGIDLKRDVITWCDNLAKELGYSGMKFITDDITNTPLDVTPDIVISLHACDVATDIVLDTAIRLGAGIILSTPCCHRYLSDKLNADELKFVSKYPYLNTKICEVLTDAIRAKRLQANSYNVTVLELTDPENTPKNTLIRAIKANVSSIALKKEQEEYDEILSFLLKDGKDSYLKEFST